MNGFLMAMMNDRYTPRTVNVIFENHTVTHTDGITYTRVHSRDRLVWIPIKLLPANPKYDEMYPISESEFEFYMRVSH